MPPRSPDDDHLIPWNEDQVITCLLDTALIYESADSFKSTRLNHRLINDAKNDLSSMFRDIVTRLDLKNRLLYRCRVIYKGHPLYESGPSINDIERLIIIYGHTPGMLAVAIHFRHLCGGDTEHERP